MIHKKISEKLPLTIQKSEVKLKINQTNEKSDSIDSYIRIKEFSSNIAPTIFFKPISKMITTDGTE